MTFNRRAAMRVAGVSAGCVLVALLPGLSQAAQRAAGGSPLTPGEIARLATPSIVTITTPSAQGSGVVIDDSGVIVTNLHVVRGETEASVKFANGDVYDDVSVIDVDERKDLLLLKVKAFGLKAASLGNSDAVKVGDRVTVLGSPKGLETTLSDGLISAIRDSGDGYRLFQTNAAASPGSSGGGLFNDHGELIGVVALKLPGGDNLNFAIPVNYVRGLLSTAAQMTLEQLAQAFPAESHVETPQRTASGGTPASDDQASQKRLTELIQATSFRSVEKLDNGWVVTFRGDNLQEVRVYVSVYEDFVVTQSVADSTPHLSSEQATEILKTNFSRNLVKAAVDEDGSLVALNETELRLLDATGLERIVNEVAVLADDIAGNVAGTLGAATVSPLVGPPAGGRLQTLRLLDRHAELRYVGSDWDSQRADEAGTFQFAHSSGGAFIKVIDERLQVPRNRMVDLFLANARQLDPNVKLTKQGSRLVNGTEMVFVEFEATLNNLPITYYAHYFSDGEGTVQIIGWSLRDLIDAYRDEIEGFVSGFRVIQR